MNPERRATSGPPARRATHRLALIALAVLAIGLEGCQSLQSVNPFRNCAGCGPLSRIGNGNGLFNRNRGRVIYDEPPIIVDQAPGVEILPGAPVITDPGMPMGSTIGPADPGLTPLPQVSPPDDALELEPLPEPSGRAPQDTLNSRANPGNNLGARTIDRASQYGPAGGPSSGDPYADRMARRSSSDVSLARPEPAPVSGPGRVGARPVLAESVAVIDRLAGPETMSPAAPAEMEAAPPPPVVPGPGSPPAAPSLAPEPAAASAPASGPEPAPPPPEPIDLSQTATTVPEPQPESGAASGIGSFHSVEPLLAGGSVPGDAGWIELANLGYRTVLDLRPIEQVRPADFASSSRAGLRHFLLPSSPGVIDALIVRRFREEISQESARPIFFCDADGSTAAALWYVHLVAEDQYDPSRARRDAERIAPIPDPLFRSAQGYLDGRNSAAPPDQAPPVADAPAPEAPAEPVDLGPTPAVAGVAAEPAPIDPAPAAIAEQPPAAGPIVSDAQPAVEPEAPAPAPAVASLPDEPFQEPSAGPKPDPESAEVSVAEVFEDPFAKPSIQDAKAWGPYAALFLTILAVPLAYWSGLGIPTGLKTRVRASLSAPARRPQSLPGGSDAGT
jgi:hypothetical protein